jgi:hypothetical protein
VRRVKQNGDLFMFMYRSGNDAADFASGGFLANSQITGSTVPGSQQQYFIRNSELNWQGGVWNMVFLGTQGAPESHCGLTDDVASIVNAGNTPTVAEKPFISVTDSGSFKLNVPQLRSNSQGVDWSVGQQIDFSEVFVADAERDDASAINAKLDEGLHVVLAPGIYQLSEPLRLSHANQVLLGLGLATLVPRNGEAAVKVADVEGVRVAGVLLDAAEQSYGTELLLQWGERGSGYGGNSGNPGMLHDVFFRVGGPVLSGVSADIMLEINSGNVIGDDLWLWRADHGPGGESVVAGNNPSKIGARVNGADVTMLGFAVEHLLEDMVQWNGDRGASYFFQAEYPYDVDQSYGDNYVAYRVADSVTSHKGMGVGVYHFFRDYPVTVKTGIVCPVGLESSFQYPLGVCLNGLGTMNHIINDLGSTTSPVEGGANPQWYCGDGAALVVV